MGNIVNDNGMEQMLGRKSLLPFKLGVPGRFERQAEIGLASLEHARREIIYQAIYAVSVYE